MKRVQEWRRIQNPEWAHEVALLALDRKRFLQLSDKYNCSDAEICLRMSHHDEALVINAAMDAKKFSKDAYETAVEFNVQQRFAAMLVHTRNWNVNRRGADMVAFISDRKADYKAAHPEMLTAGDTITNQRHFTDYIMSGVWR